MNDLIQTLARELDAAPEHVENVVRLIDEGASVCIRSFMGDAPLFYSSLV